MSILLKNAQTAICLQWRRLEKDVKLLRKICRVERFAIGVMCVDTNTMTLLNKRYRNEDRPTDILSFPFFEVCNVRCNTTGETAVPGKQGSFLHLKSTYYRPSPCRLVLFGSNNFFLKGVPRRNNILYISSV